MYYNMQEDEIILSQQYCCISWVEPIPVQDQQDAYKMTQFFKGQVEDPEKITYEKVLEDYRDYKDMYYKEINEQHECAVPYVKIRGAYRTQELCSSRIKQLESKYEKTEPVAIYCGLVGKWFPFLSKPEEASNPDLLMLMNRAVWDYDEHIQENNHEFKEHHKNVKNNYVRKPFDPEHDYLTEDKVIEKHQYFCASVFEPKPDSLEKVRTLSLKKFMYSFLLEEFKARYSSKGIETIPEFEYTDESLWSMFGKSTFEEKEFKQIGWRLLKLRGVYASEAEAQKRAEYLQKVDKNYRIDVCRMGGWLPFNPPSHLLKSHYADEEMNDIMGGLKSDIDPEVMENLKELENRMIENTEDNDNVEEDVVEIL